MNCCICITVTRIHLGAQERYCVVGALIDSAKNSLGTSGLWIDSSRFVAASVLNVAADTGCEGLHIATQDNLLR